MVERHLGKMEVESSILSIGLKRENYAQKTIRKTSVHCLQKNKLLLSQIKRQIRRRWEEIRIEKILQMVPETHGAQRDKEVIRRIETAMGV